MEVKFNEHGGKEITIKNDTFIVDITDRIEKNEGEKTVWIKLIGGYFGHPLYDYLVKNGFELNITKDESIARKIKVPPVDLPNMPKHIVSSSGVVLHVNPETGVKHVLLVKQTYGADIFKFPGGYINEGENPIDGAIREIKEEVGLSTKALYTQPVCVISSNIPSTNVLGKHGDHNFIYLLQTQTMEVTLDKNEIKDHKWVELNTYLNDTTVSPRQKVIQANLVLLMPIISLK